MLVKPKRASSHGETLKGCRVLPTATWWPRLGLVAALLTALLVAGSVSAQEPNGAVAAPTPPVFLLNTPDQNPGAFVLSGFGNADLLVSIGFVESPPNTTFTLPVTAGLSAGTGYNFVGGKTQISFIGKEADANAALAAMRVSTGASLGETTLRVTASVSLPNVYYNPVNGHYYEFVNANVHAWSNTNRSLSAFHLAENRTLFGVSGYLATITSAQEQKFVYENIPNNNVWIGATDEFSVLNARCDLGFANQAAAEGKWYWVSGPEACTQFWQGQTSAGLWIHEVSGVTQSRTTANVATSRYENWCTGNPGPSYALTADRNVGEPNNSGGEHFALEKWGGSTCWNDAGRIGHFLGTYLVEYSGAFSSGASASATLTAVTFASFTPSSATSG